MTTLIKLDLKKKNGVLFDDKNSVIKKFYLKKNFLSSKKINNEFNGHQWYSNQLNKKQNNNKRFNIKKKSNSIILPVFKGQTFNYWDKVIYKKNLVERVINHYKLIWPQEKYAPYHGDLTIENIIFLKKSGIMIIDWENFKIKELWGLDICYFLISLVVLPVLSFKKEIINQPELNLFEFYWKKTFKKNYAYLENPIEFIKTKHKNTNHFFYKITKKLSKQINKIIL